MSIKNKRNAYFIGQNNELRGTCDPGAIIVDGAYVAGKVALIFVRTAATI